MSGEGLPGFELQKKVTVKSIEELHQFIGQMVSGWPDRLIVLLQGPMGVGKTQFVREALNILGSEEVSSPSFAILNQYVTERCVVDHVDLYRIEDDEDLESTGFWDIFQRSSGFIFIEWADRLPQECFPLDWPLIAVKIERANGDDRVVEVYKRKNS